VGFWAVHYRRKPPENSLHPPENALGEPDFLLGCTRVTGPRVFWARGFKLRIARKSPEISPIGFTEDPPEKPNLKVSLSVHLSHGLVGVCVHGSETRRGRKWKRRKKGEGIRRWNRGGAAVMCGRTERRMRERGRKGKEKGEGERQ